jgi:hypothetical protein
MTSIVLDSAFEGVTDGVAGLSVGPVAIPDVVGPAAEEQFERLLVQSPDHLALSLGCIGHGPSAEGEAAAGVLLWPSWSLDYPVEADVLGNDELAHVGVHTPS